MPSRHSSAVRHACFLHHGDELVRSRLPAPLRLEQNFQLRELVERQGNLVRRFDLDLGFQIRVPDEQRGPDQQEVQQGLAQQMFDRSCNHEYTFRTGSGYR